MAVEHIDDWRRAGCDHRCTLEIVIPAGLLRRTARESHDPDAHEEYGRLLTTGRRRATLRTGVLEVDLEHRVVAVNGVECSLSIREWELLAVLANRPGRWITAAEIRRLLFGEQAGLFSSNYHRNIRHRLRVQLGEAGALIESRAQSFRLALLPPDEQCQPDRVVVRRSFFAREYSACTRCGGTDAEHAGHGLCSRCRARERREAAR
jgi:hypothetical protein